MGGFFRLGGYLGGGLLPQIAHSHEQVKHCEGASSGPCDIGYMSETTSAGRAETSIWVNDKRKGTYELT